MICGALCSCILCLLYGYSPLSGIMEPDVEQFSLQLAGAALLGVGIWAAVSANAFKDLISSEGLIYAVIVVGAVIFLIGFLGCCGAVNENKCLLGSVSLT